MKEYKMKEYSLDEIMQSIIDEDISYDEIAYLNNNQQKVLEYGDIRLAEWAGISEEEWREQKLKTKGDIEYEDERVNYQSY